MKTALSKTFLALILPFAISLVVAIPTFADTPPPPPTPPQTGGLGFGAPATCNGRPGLNFGLGCIASTPTGIANFLASLVLGMGGGIAVILIIIGGYKVGASHGDPYALEEGRSMITAAIIGLVFMLLATVILGILGVDVLGLKFFSHGSGGSVIISS